MIRRNRPSSPLATPLSRRAMLAGLGHLVGAGAVATLGSAGCKRESKPAAGQGEDASAGPRAVGENEWREASLAGEAAEPAGSTAGAAMHALFYEPRRALAAPVAPANAPPDAGSTARSPLLVALHGRGESGRGLEVGARAWRDDYRIDRVAARLAAPPLTRADLQGFATDDRLARLNASLAAAPFGGLALACPYTPDLRDKSPAGAAGFGRCVVERLLPKTRNESTSLPATERTTGIDGVSMGGRLALLVGFANPHTFASIGALQPALRVDEAPLFAELAREAQALARFHLRLVSSEGDPFLPAVRALSTALSQAGVEHGLVVTPGPHDYAWNRGPGATEMLVFHERVLRGLAAP